MWHSCSVIADFVRSFITSSFVIRRLSFPVVRLHVVMSSWHCPVFRGRLPFVRLTFPSLLTCVIFFYVQVASAPPGTQAACLDIVKAYRNSPIITAHKCYLPIHWRGGIFPDHVAPYGLTTAGGVQGTSADAMVDICRYRNTPHTYKWVDDYIFFRVPSSSHSDPSGSTIFVYDISLKTVYTITDPLGVIWHDISEKGHDFQSQASYVGFLWDIDNKCISLPDHKRLRYIQKVGSFLLNSRLPVHYSDVASLHGTLQHASFIYRDGRSVDLNATQRCQSWSSHSGDNTGVIDAYKRGRSSNVSRNLSIRRITSTLIPLNLSLSPVYMPSHTNRADPISRGNLGPPSLHLSLIPELPYELSSFLTPCIAWQWTSQPRLTPNVLVNILPFTCHHVFIKPSVHF